MSQIDITTSQNVNITFTLASVGDRIVAFILDCVVMLAYGMAVILFFVYVLNIEYFFSRMDDWSVRAVLILLFLPVSFYALACEMLMEGQTFGKKIMKIKAVKIDGYQAGFGDFVMRWIFRTAEIWITSGIPAVISIIVSGKNQRLGDMASGTAVISLKNSVNISHTILENLKEDYVPSFPQVIALSDNDMRIIKENFQKAVRIDDRMIISRLTTKIKEILKLEYDERQFTQRQFIGTVIKDYNFYTGKGN
ncbi:MAG: RDD family protein [Bergeyella sp.]